MALVECKECGAKISDNAAACPSCGDIIKEPKPAFSLLDVIHKISIPVVLSVAGTMITILTYFGQEEERKMEQTRKLLADAFDKDPIKQQYCIFYVDQLLASGRISPQMTVSVLSTVAANSTSENVRLEALRSMPRLLEQKNYEPELKPLLTRSIPALIPSIAEVEVLSREAILDLQTLVNADESLRGPLISELTELDRRWALISNKTGGDIDRKQNRIALQIKLSLFTLEQTYDRVRKIALSLLDLAKNSPELEAFVRNQLQIARASSPRTVLRVAATSVTTALERGDPVPPRVDERGQGDASVFIVIADESRRNEGQKLVQALGESGINTQGIDVLSDDSKSGKLRPPEYFEIRFWKNANNESLSKRLADTVEKYSAAKPKLFAVAALSDIDPETYEIWFPGI
jgi:hypothetical protein